MDERKRRKWSLNLHHVLQQWKKDGNKRLIYCATSVQSLQIRKNPFMISVLETSKVKDKLFFCSMTFARHGASTSTPMYVYARTCVCFPVHTAAGACACACVHVQVYVLGCVWACGCVWAYVRASVSVFLHARVWLRVYGCKGMLTVHNFAFTPQFNKDRKLLLKSNTPSIWDLFWKALSRLTIERPAKV